MTELRDALAIKEKEKEIFVQHLNLNSADPNYGAKMLEQQSEKIIALQTANEEYELR